MVIPEEQGQLVSMGNISFTTKLFLSCYFTLIRLTKYWRHVETVIKGRSIQHYNFISICISNHKFTLVLSTYTKIDSMLVQRLLSYGTSILIFNMILEIENLHKISMVFMLLSGVYMFMSMKLLLLKEQAYPWKEIGGLNKRKWQKTEEKDFSQKGKHLMTQVMELKGHPFVHHGGRPDFSSSNT